MEAQDVINLLDACWFHQDFFKKSSEKPTSSSLRRTPDRQITEILPQLEISIQVTIHTRSKSEQAMSPKAGMDSGFISPKSVLPAPHLETILSGIEGEGGFRRTPQTRRVKTEEEKKKKKAKRKKAMKGLSKSLSVLEFEELKGFMDLGFVFSEEDKRDSTLVEIIPGLQRLGKENRKSDEEKNRSTGHDSPSVTRPYLSEAWEALGSRKRENPLINWKVPSVSNEIGMKDSLKRWAHTVASRVR